MKIEYCGDCHHRMQPNLVFSPENRQVKQNINALVIHRTVLHDVSFGYSQDNANQ